MPGTASKMEKKKLRKKDRMKARGSNQVTGRVPIQDGILSNGSSLEKNKSIEMYFEKVTESCVTESGKDGDVSVGIAPPSSASQGPVSADGLGQNLQKGTVLGVKRKRNDQAEAEKGKSDDQDGLRKERLSEEARAWQYVCRRSVFLSPPLPAQTPDNEKVAVANRHLKRYPPLFEQKVGHSISKTILFTTKTAKTKVIVNHNVVNVTLTREGTVVQEWIERQSTKRFGLDLEWQPNRRKGGKENKVALMQISTETDCLLVQMLFLDSIPSTLIHFLHDPERKIAGVGIHGDTQKLHRDYGLVCHGEVELTTLAVDLLKNQELKRVGLKVLAKHVLGFDMNKHKSVTMSNWAKSHLDSKQVEYACMDAWVSLAIFCRLQTSSLRAS